ncbi:hypothetical protein [Embleya sp. NBC_00896]|uniref:hypothetical protein n=1 Tax=Embleya sp. NBC_00896 TaxID=2975961 RepID=UPI00386FAD0B|nr:hypothetical protein OG928_32305 [Embleya sp. NBC_00896]
MEYRDEPVLAATWMRQRVAIHNFYDWAVDDVELLDRRPYHRRENGKDVLSVTVVNDLDVRHLTYSQWRFLKQVRLRGLLPDKRSDRSFRGAVCGESQGFRHGVHCNQAPQKSGDVPVVLRTHAAHRVLKKRVPCLLVGGRTPRSGRRPMSGTPSP